MLVKLKKKLFFFFQNILNVQRFFYFDGFSHFSPLYQHGTTRVLDLFYGGAGSGVRSRCFHLLLQGSSHTPSSTFPSQVFWAAALTRSAEQEIVVVWPVEEESVQIGAHLADRTGRVGSGRVRSGRVVCCSSGTRTEGTRVQDGEMLEVERNRRPHSASFADLSIPQASDNSPEDRTPEPLPPSWE